MSRPVASPATSSDTARRRLPGKGAVVGVTVLTAALLALAATQTWVSGAVDDPVLGHRVVGAGARTVAPAALGLTLAAGAGALASSVVGRWGRLVAGAIVIACAAGVLAVTVGVARSPQGALEQAAAGAVGRASGAVVSDVALSPWVWVAAVLAVLLLLEGVVVLVAARRWSGLSARYDAPAATSALVLDDAAPEGDAGRAATAGSADADRPDAPTTPASADERRRREARAAVQDWDRLSAGEDPTR